MSTIDNIKQFKRDFLSYSVVDIERYNNWHPTQQDILNNDPNLRIEKIFDDLKSRVEADSQQINLSKQDQEVFVNKVTTKLNNMKKLRLEKHGLLIKRNDLMNQFKKICDNFEKAKKEADDWDLDVEHSDLIKQVEAKYDIVNLKPIIQEIETIDNFVNEMVVDFDVHYEEVKQTFIDIKTKAETKNKDLLEYIEEQINQIKDSFK